MENGDKKALFSPGAVANLIRKTINADVPYVPWLTGYLAIAAGAALTFVVQSSSVFTSTLTPLVGVGLITVDRVYPLTLGSNLGTTTTALLAAFAAEPGRQLRNSVQIALCHMFFNLSGILLFYPAPFMRWPLVLCKALGRTTARYRWFALLYLVLMFFVAPAAVLALSVAGGALALAAALGPLAAGVVFVLAVNAMQVVLVVYYYSMLQVTQHLLHTRLQDKCPKALPGLLRNWDFLPPWLRSLGPLDSLLGRLSCCGRSYEGVPPQGNDHEDHDEDDGQFRM